MYQKNRFKVRMFSRLMRFSAWLQDIPNKVTPPPFRLLQIGSAFWQSRLLYVAARLDIATQIAEDSLPADEIAARLSSHPAATYRLLRALAAMGIFTEIAPRTFKNNRLSSCLREGDPQNVRAMILMHNSREMSQPWYEQLEQGVKSGEAPFVLTHKDELYAYMSTHPDFSALFSTAMDRVEVLSGDSFATDFNWRRFARIIDVGGARGSKSLAILKHHPHLRALVIDRPSVIEEARRYWQARPGYENADRLQFESGDVLRGISVSDGSDQDAYLLSGVLHGFDDETCIKALTNITAAIGDSQARILIMELVMDETQPDYASSSFDMQMFMGTHGRERTLLEWRAVLANSGVRLEEVVSLQSFVKILVARPESHADKA